MKYILGLLAVGALGFVGGAGAMLVVYPFIFPPPQVNETVDQALAGNLVLTGAFREGVDGQDAGHWGEGGVKVYHDEANGKYLVEFQHNFEVGPGPNFWIYLNGSPGIDNEDDFQADASRAKIAKIKSFKGSQVYEIDAAKYESAKALTIWCESFNQYIASVDLT